ncbi:barstar family protein [Sutterella sp.]|uniref:barstar family protein n=1 Tax=Sutterella sp. TaxID=1981025 RepID=UPI003FD7155D
MTRLLSTPPVEVECTGLTKPQLFEAFAAALKLPDWFGRNLDALYDALTDLEGPETIDLVGWEDAALSLADRRAFEGVFSDAVAQAGADRLQIRLVSEVLPSQDDPDEDD